jgi:hypothetical protein
MRVQYFFSKRQRAFQQVPGSRYFPGEFGIYFLYQVKIKHESIFLDGLQQYRHLVCGKTCIIKVLQIYLKQFKLKDVLEALQMPVKKIKFVR